MSSTIDTKVHFAARSEAEAVQASDSGYLPAIEAYIRNAFNFGLDDDEIEQDIEDQFGPATGCCMFVRRIEIDGAFLVTVNIESSEG